MYQGSTLEELGRKVERQAALKDDLVVDTRRLTMLGGDALLIGEGTIGSGAEYSIEQIAHRQIGERLGIPARFYDGLRTATRKVGNEDVAHDAVRQLLDRNVNTLFRERPERRLIRTFKAVEGEGDQWGLPADNGKPGVARCFLSDHYRKRDHEELLGRIVPVLSNLPGGSKVISCAVTDTRLYLKVVTEQLQADVRPGDPVCAGVVIRNSEVGHGSLSIVPMIYTFVCLNGMTTGWATEGASRYAHLGPRITADDSGRYSSATLKLDDEAFYAKVEEDVRRAVDETTFNAIVVSMREAANTDKLQSPVEAIERLSKRNPLSDDESKSVLRHLAEGGDLTAYGLLNAVTRTAQDAGSYERATELEAMGGAVLATVGTKEWAAIAA